MLAGVLAFRRPAGADEAAARLLAHTLQREDTQEAWRRYSTSQCDLYMSVFEGTMWHPLSDQCVLRKVEERTRELAEVRREYEAGP